MKKKTEPLKKVFCENSLEPVTFKRKELAMILKIYGQMVASGKWRDYGISSIRGQAIFSIFRRTTEHPIYMIIKNPEMNRKQGAYSIIAMDGQILKRGHDLTNVLQVLNKKLIRAVT